MPRTGETPAHELSSQSVTVFGNSYQLDARGRNVIYSTSLTSNGQRVVFLAPFDGSREPMPMSIDFQNQVSDFDFTPDGRHLVILHRGVGPDEPHLYARPVSGRGEMEELLGPTVENGRILGMDSQSRRGACGVRRQPR